jgi:multiple sugar transport system permease protein
MGAGVARIGRFGDRRARLTMIGPAFVTLIAVLIYPLGYTVWISLHNQKVGREAGSLTLERYGEVLTNGSFWHGMAVSAQFLVGAVALELVLGVLLALLISRPTPGMAVLRGLIILPVLLSPVIAGILFKLLLNEEFGVVNEMLGWVGLGPVEWLSHATQAKISIILMDAWQWTPFMALLIAAGIGSLPPEPLEAAAIDGARPWQRLRLVTLPMLSRVIFVTVAFRIVFALATLASVLVLNDGGPSQATNLFSLYVYQQGFQFFNTSYAAAASMVVMTIVLVLFAVCFGPLLRRWETGRA